MISAIRLLPGWLDRRKIRHLFTFDLGGIAQIDEVTTHVYPYPHWGIDYATGYKVEISTNNWQWITIHDDSEAYEKNGSPLKQILLYPLVLSGSPSSTAL